MERCQGAPSLHTRLVTTAGWGRAGRGAPARLLQPIIAPQVWPRCNLQGGVQQYLTHRTSYDPCNGDTKVPRVDKSLNWFLWLLQSIWLHNSIHICPLSVALSLNCLNFLRCLCVWPWQAVEISTATRCCPTVTITADWNGWTEQDILFLAQHISQKLHLFCIFNSELLPLIGSI